MPSMRGQRNDVIRSTKGYTIHFTKGEIIWVPDNAAVVAECTQRGHTIVDEEAKDVEAKAAPAKVEPEKVPVPPAPPPRPRGPAFKVQNEPKK